jgi:cobalamin biosynthesis protein CbiD
MKLLPPEVYAPDLLHPTCCTTASAAAAACCLFILQERVQKVKLLLPEAYALHQENCSAVQDIFGRFAAAASSW